MPRLFFRLIVFLAVLAFVGVAGWMVYDRVLNLEVSDLSDLDGAARKAYLNTHKADLDRPVGQDDTPVVFVVSPGETGQRVADRLYELGLIGDRTLFRSFVSEQGLTIEVGEYTLRQTMTLREIAEVLQHGQASELVLTIPEGRRLEEVADLAAGVGVDRDEFIALATTGSFDFDFLADRPANATLEGFLFPDTYRLPQDVTAADLIQRMLANFDAKVTPAQSAGENRTLYEVVVLASIVEREAVLVEEQPTIASVYLNRLAAGIKLDADPTIQYALGAAGDWWPQITIEQYTSVDSPWNTYLYAGLPPSPIANPGLGAIQAVLNPADTPYYFFMRDCEKDDGSHWFAATSDEHLTNYARCAGN